MEQGKIILLQEPGKIITPRPLPEANAIKARKPPRAIEQIAKDVFYKMPAEEQEKVKKAFEEKFGTDKATRTKEQWKNLVSTYGADNVCKLEKITLKKLQRYCGFKEKKSSQLKKK